MKNKIIVGIIVGVAMVSVGSFYAGMKFSQIQRSFSGRNLGNRGEQMINSPFAKDQKSPRGNLGGIINGEIISKDNIGITVKQRDGGSRIILISDKTLISKLASSTKEELSGGLQITGYGTPNPDGSLNAESIQIK